MNRRCFLLAVVIAPAVPLLPRLPAPTPLIYGGGASGSMSDWLDKTVNPPLIIASDGSVSKFHVQYRKEYIEAFEEHKTLIRKVAEITR